MSSLHHLVECLHGGIWLCLQAFILMGVSMFLGVISDTDRPLNQRKAVHRYDIVVCAVTLSLLAFVLSIHHLACYRYVACLASATSFNKLLLCQTVTCLALQCLSPSTDVLHITSAETDIIKVCNGVHQAGDLASLHF